MIYLTITIAILLTAVVTALVFKSFSSNKGVDEKSLQEMQQHLLDRTAMLHEQQMSQQRENYERQIADLSRRLESRDKEMRDLAANQFTTLATQIFDRQSENLRNDNARSVTSLLEPLKMQLENFRNEFQGNSKTTLESHHALRGEIDALIKLNRTIGEEANNLARALKGNSQVVGSWGEQILESLLEKSGLVKDINYCVQQTTDEYGRMLADESGRRKRPDVVLSLPGNRKIIIDSKVSLSSYLKYCQCEDGEDKRRIAKAHVSDIKKHIDEIVVADYPSVIDGSCEMVIMFMPNEQAYFTAFHSDQDLWKYAYERKVMLATPTHLFAIVQLVEQLWQQDMQNKNAEEIGRTAGALYDRMVDFITKLEAMGNKIDKLQEEYKKCFNSATYGKRSVCGIASQLKEMGASTTQTLSPRLHIADEQEDQMDSKDE